MHHDDGSAAQSWRWLAGIPHALDRFGWQKRLDCLLAVAKPADATADLLADHDALGLAQDGADLAINYRGNEDEARKTLDEVRALGREEKATKAIAE
mgnify:CR=1 FL=1